MMMQHLDGFGAFLASVRERDIDLLLLEEFHVSPAFGRWFASQAGIDDAEADGAWHSVTDADGETDLLLRVMRGAERIALLTENKIGAAEQDRQDERYHLRAARAQNEGKYDAFVTCMCAPRAYLDALPTTSLYQAKISYEAIAEWFGASGDRRSAWRKAVIGEAIAQGRRGYNMIVNQSASTFFMDFWKYLQLKHPGFVMRRPEPKGNKSNWILFKGANFPRNVGFHIKLDQSVVELGFKNRRVDDLASTATVLPTDIFPVQKGQTAALSMSVPRLDRDQPLADQIEALEAVMNAVLRLAPYATIMEDRS